MLLDLLLLHITDHHHFGVGGVVVGLIEVLHVRQGQLGHIGRYPVGRLTEAVLLAVDQLAERLPGQPLGLLLGLLHPLQQLRLDPLEVRLPHARALQHLAHQRQGLGQLVRQRADGDEVVVLGTGDINA